MAILLMHVLCVGLVLPLMVLGQVVNNTLPSTCDSDAYCDFLWSNSRCNAGGVCECTSGYCVNRNGYFCEKVKIGTGCPAGPNGDGFCQNAVTDAICDSRYGVCRCPDGQGNIAGDGFNRCAAGMKSPICETCISSGGTCQDLNADGTADKCGCPEFFTSSNPEDSLATGCDLKEVPTGACCSAEGGEIKCADPNAECTYANDLSIYHYCTCRLGYVAVPRDFDPTHADCRQIINGILDPDCSMCVSNGGTCYTMNEDGLIMDGCLCPPLRSSSKPGPEFACDTRHVDMNCSLEDPTICFDPASDSRYAFLGNQLISGQSILYVRGHANNFYCQFQMTEHGFCISQSQAVAHCQSESKEHKFFISHATWLVLRYNADYISSRDICLYAYCRYDKFAKVSTSEVIVAERKLISSEGFHVKPSLVIVASDKFGMNVEIGGIKLGDQLQLKITMTDNKGIYTSLRVETCIVSDHVSLNLATTRAVAFIQDSCPKENSFLPKGTNFFPILGDQYSHQTGFFSPPKFENIDYLFFHCAIRVCIDPNNCEPMGCHAPGGIVKRSVTGPITLPKTVSQLVTYRLSKRSDDSSIYDVNQALESPDLTHKLIGIKVLPDENRQKRPNNKYYQEAELQHEHAFDYARAYDDDYYNPPDMPTPAREHESLTVIVVSVLFSLLAALLVTSIVFFVGYIVPKRARRQSAVRMKSDVVE